MNKGTKDNRGFSLVELIVVILIMAILAVALTPQVLKWVNNARIANDRTLMDTLVSNCQTALANPTVYDDLKDDATAKVEVVNTSGTTTVSFTATKATNFKAKLAEYLGHAGKVADTDFAKSLKLQTSGGKIVVTINKGTVEGKYYVGTEEYTAEKMDAIVTGAATATPAP